MTLGEIIKEYRNLHCISQRQFEKLSGLSNSYISQLEQNQNSKNGLPIAPSLVAIKQTADAMDMPLDDLLHQMDDIPVDVSAQQNAETLDRVSAEIMRRVASLPDNLKLSLLDILRAISSGAET